jgi:hypothetical protein
MLTDVKFNISSFHAWVKNQAQIFFFSLTLVYVILTPSSWVIHTLAYSTFLKQLRSPRAVKSFLWPDGINRRSTSICQIKSVSDPAINSDQTHFYLACGGWASVKLIRPKETRDSFQVLLKQKWKASFYLALTLQFWTSYCYPNGIPEDVVVLQQHLRADNQVERPGYL